MTKYFLDEEKIISGHFKSEQIEHYTRELGSRIEAIIYLWAFNNFSVHYPDDLEDLGRPMYRKLAEKLSKILCVKKSDENVTQTDLRNIEDMQAEINRLRETLIRINTLLSENIRPCIFKNATTVSVPIVTLERLTAIIRHSLNREREGKND